MTVPDARSARASRQRAAHSRWMTFSAHTGYALGLRVTADLRRGMIVSHAGGLPGFKLHMTWHPVSGAGVVVLTNSHRGDPVALCTEALGRSLDRQQAQAATVAPWPETTALREQADRLVRCWDDDVASRILAPNVDFDRPLAERRAEIERFVEKVGPLLEPRGRCEIVSTLTPADVTWSIPGRHGELLCMIHLTPVEPAQIQELVVKAYPTTRPRRRGRPPSRVNARSTPRRRGRRPR